MLGEKKTEFVPSILDIYVQINDYFQEKAQKEALTRKQQKNRTKQQQMEDDSGPQELLQKPREYTVKFTFPNPPPLQPPVLGLYGEYLS